MTSYIWQLRCACAPVTWLLGGLNFGEMGPKTFLHHIIQWWGQVCYFLHRKPCFLCMKTVFGQDSPVPHYKSSNRSSDSLPDKEREVVRRYSASLLTAHWAFKHMLTMSSGHAIFVNALSLSVTTVVLYFTTLPIQLNVVMSAQNLTTVTHCYSTFQSLHYKSFSKSRTTLLVLFAVSGSFKFQRLSEDWRPKVWVTLATNQTMNPS